MVDGDPSRSSVSVAIDTRTVSASTDLLTDLVRSSRVLDVARYPEASFVSRRIRRDGRAPDRYVISGELTLRGVTRTLEVAGTLRRRSGHLVAETDFSVRRQDFGIRPGGLLELLVHDEVRIEMEVVAEPRPACYGED